MYNAYELVMCGFPYRRLKRNPDGSIRTHFERKAKVYDPKSREIGEMRLVLSTVDDKVDIAFGALDRALLMWIQTLAVRQESNVVRWPSHKEFFDDLELGSGGINYKRFRDSFERLVNTMIKVEYTENVGKGKVGTELPVLDVERWVIPGKKEFKAEMRGQRSLFGYVATLSESLWKSLQERQISYRLDVIAHFTDWPLAMDLVMFIHHRLLIASANPKTIRIPYAELREQLGSQSENDERLRHEIKRAINEIRRVWKEVNVDLLHGGMLELRPPTDGKFLTFDKPNKKEKDIDGEVVPPEPEPGSFDAGEQTSLGFADESESKAREPKPRTTRKARREAKEAVGKSKVFCKPIRHGTQQKSRCGG